MTISGSIRDTATVPEVPLPSWDLGGGPSHYGCLQQPIIREAAILTEDSSFNEPLYKNCRFNSYAIPASPLIDSAIFSRDRS
jgi:hypothetical protein